MHLALRGRWLYCAATVPAIVGTRFARAIETFGIKALGVESVCVESNSVKAASIETHCVSLWDWGGADESE